MLTSLISQLRILIAKQKRMLGLVVTVWFLTNSIVYAHQNHTHLETDKHCTQCLAQSTLNHAILSHSNFTAPLSTTQATATPHFDNEQTVTPSITGNRDPPSFLSSHK